MSRLTVLYSEGQVLGSPVTTQLALHFNSYNPALLAAARVAGIATIVTLIDIREPLAARTLAKPFPNTTFR